MSFTRIHVDFLSGLVGAFKSDITDVWMLCGTGDRCGAISQMHEHSVELGMDVWHHKELHCLLFEDFLCGAFMMLNIWESAAVCFLLKYMELLKEENI